MVAQRRGALEIQRFRGLLHLSLQPLNDRFRMAFQEFAQVVNHLAVLRLVHRPNAGGEAQLDIVVQAGARVLPADLTVTGEIRENAPEHIQGLVQGPHAGIGAVVTRPVLKDLARDGHAGERHIPMHLDIGVALIILHADVVLRAIALDQVHLQDQRFQL